MIVRTALLLCLSSLPVAGSAHHAIAGNYDAGRIIEVEGEVTDVLWRNPHAQVSMRVTDQSGESQIWEMAMDSVSNMRRWQIDPDFIEVGDTIRVAGNPARRIDYGLYIRNVLTREGQEVVLGRNTARRWSGPTIEMSESRRTGIGDTSAPELGIFRVWSTPDTIPMLFPRDLGRNPTTRANLTAAALEAVDAFEFLRDSPLRDCALKGMPLIMESPYPSEFTRNGEDIIWRIEEYDTVRTIHMAPDTSPEGQPDSLLGYSIGRWEDDRTLVVTTTHMGWGHFDGQGIPASSAAELVERFAVSPGGDRLDYTMTFTDPEYLIEPVTLGKHWVWYPDAEVGVYDCSVEAESF
ncbi:MAG TPA: DUF6152 family protein [Gammaproteobacteria bacterium]